MKSKLVFLLAAACAIVPVELSQSPIADDQVEIVDASQLKFQVTEDGKALIDENGGYWRVQESDDDADDDLAGQIVMEPGSDWAHQSVPSTFQEPVKAGVGAASKPIMEESYQDIFGNPHKKKKKPKNKDAKRQRGKAAHEKRMAAYQAGLPGFVIAEIDPLYYLSQMGVSSAIIKKAIKDGTVKDIKQETSTGEAICKRLAWGISNGVDVSCSSTHWLNDRGACLFQVLMDEGVDEVLDWLEERDEVIQIEGDTPLNAPLKNRY